MTSIRRAITPTTGFSNGHTPTTTTMEASEMEASEMPGTTLVRSRIEAEISVPGRPMQCQETRRKRRSFFGRSSSDASTHKPLPQLEAAISTPNALTGPSQPELPPKRPGTSNGEHPVRRKTTDQLEHIRHSIFGGKKLAGHVRPMSKRSRHSHQASTRDINNTDTNLIPFTAPAMERLQPKGNAGGQVYKSEDDFYHHRKKSSISSPYNFKHVMHTSRTHLPRLDTVDERELSAQLNEAGFRPQNDLRGISADELAPSRLRETSSSPKRAISRVGTPAGFAAVTDDSSSKSRNDSGVDETTFDETQETKFDPAEHFDSFRGASAVHNQGSNSPRHSLSSPSLRSSNSSASRSNQQLRNKTSLGNVRAQEGSPRAATAGLHASLSRAPEALNKIPIRGRPAGQSFREKQPLPPLPGSGQLVRKTSKDSNRSRQSVGQKLQQSPYPASVISKRSSKSATAGQLSESRKPEILDALDWEADIDFAFEQEAEATCDFDWGQVPPSSIAEGGTFPAQLSPNFDEESPDSNDSGGVRLSAWIDEPSALTSETISPGSVGTGVSTPDTQHVQHKRGTSVGHRGFQAARNASSDKLTKTPPLPPSVEIVSEQASPSQPPIFSVTGADAVAAKSPCHPGSYFPAFDSNIPDYLSDPESTRLGGSRHRKSSSYGSFESSGRSLQSLNTASDSTRWSTASTSSIPDLMHSHRKPSRNSIRKSLTSQRPLESVPHSPGAESLLQDRKLAPAARPEQWERGTSEGILMRRPATPGDRALLFNSGRMVQRGRSATPSRMAVRSLAGHEQEGGWF